MCQKCKGDGIIGAGERPWEKAGATGTCDMCGGTGKVSGIDAEPADQPANEEFEPIAEVVEEAPVDPVQENDPEEAPVDETVA